MFAQVVVARALTSTQDFATESDFQNLFSYYRDRSVSVAQRPHPEFDQIGMRFGQFDLLPSLGIGFGYDDNIYSSPVAATHGAYYTISPGAVFSTESGSSAAWADVQLALKRYFSVGSADENGGRVAGGGRLEINRDISIVGQISDERRYEESDSIGTPEDASEPVAVTNPETYLSAVFTGVRFRNAITIQATRFSYDDVRSFSGTLIDETYRNQNIYRVLQRTEFALSPEVAIIEAATFTRTNYDSKLPLDDKDSHEARGLLGISYDLTNLIRGELAVGYLDREFYLNSFLPIRGVAALVKLDYFLTPLTTVSLWARRAVDDAALIGVNAFFSNTANLQIDHELLRNVILSGIFSYQFDQYSDPHGEDHSFNETLKASYLMSHSLHLNFEVNHVNRSTSGIAFAENYGATRLLLSFNLLL